MIKQIKYIKSGIWQNEEIWAEQNMEEAQLTNTMVLPTLTHFVYYKLRS